MRAPRSRSPRHSSALTFAQRREISQWVEANFIPDQHLGGDDGQHVKRPLNAFMLYKKHKLDTRRSDGANDSIEADTTGKEHLCARIASMWKALSDSERAVWYDRAREWKRRHEEAFPGYKYIPRRGKHLSSLPSTAMPTPRTVSPESPLSDPCSTSSLLFSFSSDEASSPATSCYTPPKGWTPLEESCGPLASAVPMMPFMSESTSYAAPTFYGFSPLSAEPVFDLQEAAPAPGSMWWPEQYTNTYFSHGASPLPSPSSPIENEDCLPSYDSDCVPSYQEQVILPAAQAPAQPSFDADLHQHPGFGPIHLDQQPLQQQQFVRPQQLFMPQAIMTC